MMDKIKLQNVGTVSIDGHEAAKIKMTIEGEGDVFLYFAKDMKNLLIRVDGGGKQGGALTISNISFDVPDDLFQIPAGYKREDLSSFKSRIDRKTVK